MPEYKFCIEHRWVSHPSNVHYARRAIRSFVLEHAPDFAELIELAIGEACANAVEHGSPAGVDNFFTVRCGVVSSLSELVFEVEDEGVDFNLSHVSVSHVPDLESEGGRGLYLINQIMDDVALRYSSSGMIVRMIKRIEKYNQSHSNILNVLVESYS